MPEVQQDIQTEDKDSSGVYIGLRLQAGRSEQEEVQAVSDTRLIKCTECKREFYSDHILKTTCSHNCTMEKGRRRNNARRQHGKASK